MESIMGAFGFTDFEVNLSTRPEKAVGSDEIWSTAEAALEEALQSKVSFGCLHVALAASRLIPSRSLYSLLALLRAGVL